MWSYRRILLDSDLEKAKSFMKGTILDLGGGRKRGTFKEPDDVEWIVLDRNRGHRPHIWGDAHSIPMKSQAVDCVKCTELLEHLEYPEKALEEISRILKPGGTLILSIPFNVDIHNDPCDFQRFTDEKLRRVLQGDFDIVALKKEGFFFTVLGYMIKQAIFNAKSGKKRFFYWLLPVLDVIVKLDNRASVQNSRFMSSFTTGFFVVAVKK